MLFGFFFKLILNILILGLGWEHSATKLKWLWINVVVTYGKLIGLTFWVRLYPARRQHSGKASSLVRMLL